MGLIVLALSGAAVPAEALACTPAPFPRPPEPTQAQVDERARLTFTEVAYVAQVVVERAPRYQMGNEKGPPPPGRPRVVAVIKGEAPKVIDLPVADPCLLYFQKVGERVIVGAWRGNSPKPLEPRWADSLRSQRLGDWTEVR